MMKPKQHIGGAWKRKERKQAFFEGGAKTFEGTARNGFLKEGWR
jgi:hypothetical protein